MTAVGTASQLATIASYEIFTYRPTPLSAYAFAPKEIDTFTALMSSFSDRGLPQTFRTDRLPQAERNQKLAAQLLEPNKAALAACRNAAAKTHKKQRSSGAVPAL
jgi:hypothetical protein